MKASINTLDSLSDMGKVATSGDIRRIGGQMLLALARKEIPSGDVEAASRMIAAQAAHLAAEVKVARAVIELREKGADLGKLSAMGQMLIGTPDAQPSDEVCTNPFPSSIN